MPDTSLYAEFEPETLAKALGVFPEGTGVVYVELCDYDSKWRVCVA